MIDYLQALKHRCDYENISVFVDPVLRDPRFGYWSGAGKDIHHHYGDGGLVKHTNEVLDYARLIAMLHNSTCIAENRVNVQELLISVIWHDYGKIWDYQKVGKQEVWGKYDNHARQIHHISRSAIEWEKYASTLPLELWNLLEAENRVINPENITHNILSHHGMREWGSPVAPATREAWILHLADNLSARLDDCDKHDIVKH